MKRLDRDEHGVITLQGRVERLELLWQVLAGVVIVAVLIVALTGCGDSAPIGLRNESSHFWQDLGDGTRLECWYISRGNSQSATGGPTCDWISYHKDYGNGGVR